MMMVPHLAGSLSVELDGGFGSAGLALHGGAGVVLSGHGSVDGGRLSVSGVHAVDVGGDDGASRSIAEEGDESKLEEKGMVSEVVKRHLDR